MKNFEEKEMKLYEKLKVKKILKLVRKAEQISDNISLALTFKKKRVEKADKLKNGKKLDITKKMEGILDYQKNIKYDVAYYMAIVMIYALFAGLFISLHAPLVNIGIFGFGVSLGLMGAITCRYEKLKAKKIKEKWYSKYEHQREDVLGDIMTKNKELDHPQVEIISQNNKLERTSLVKLTGNAKLSELKRYRTYLTTYKEARENNCDLPTLTYDKKRGKTLRLVHNYTKENR